MKPPPLSSQSRSAGVPEFPEKRVRLNGTHSRQTGVAGSRVVAALGLEMAQEGANEVGAQIAEFQGGRRFLQFPQSVADQRAECVPVASNRVRAGLALLHYAVGEEWVQKSGEGSRGFHTGRFRGTRSSRRAASWSSSGVAVRYQ